MEPNEKLVMTVPEAGKKLGLSKEAAYAAAKRGQIPTIRIGHLLKVPVVQFNRLLNGAEVKQNAPASEEARAFAEESLSDNGIARNNTPRSPRKAAYLPSSTALVGRSTSDRPESTAT